MKKYSDNDCDEDIATRVLKALTRLPSFLHFIDYEAPKVSSDSAKRHGQLSQNGRLGADKHSAIPKTTVIRYTYGSKFDVYGLPGWNSVSPLGGITRVFQAEYSL
ncbi:hypothetical protein JTB14_033805 [Gonioctena quinquepunctata]|nr:hypothetical protein JTB14_033805 [Gonioctena quinquepunctata]